MYDYVRSMEVDIYDFISSNFTEAEVKTDYDCIEDFESYLEDLLWTEDSVTGNGSGSYTFNRAEAKDYVCDNIDLLHDAIDSFGISTHDVADHFLDEDWEYFDVTIRCYCLSEALHNIIDSLDIDFDEEDEEEG